jgi:2-dehydropantoate 2-reductase
MRIAVYGAGAVGAYLGAGLAAAGADVTLIARGEHLEAMRRDGVRVIEGGRERTVHVRCLGDPLDAGPQDYVIVALKAHQVSGATEGIRALLGPQTAVVTAQNGIPWWYFYGVEGPLGGRRLESVDPGGRIWDAIGPQRAIGCVVYPACEVAAPGVIRHIEGDRFALGEPTGERSERVDALAANFTAAGFRAPVRRNIRNEVWVKLWGNVAFNPISVLTRATLAAVCADPLTRAFARAVMLEAQAVARALGEEMPVTVDARIEGAAHVGDHKTSMLQDLEQGREMEVDALVGAVVELGALTGVPTPLLQGLYGMVRLLQRQTTVASQ